MTPRPPRPTNRVVRHLLGCSLLLFVVACESGGGSTSDTTVDVARDAAADAPSSSGDTPAGLSDAVLGDGRTETSDGAPGDTGAGRDAALDSGRDHGPPDSGGGGGCTTAEECPAGEGCVAGVCGPCESGDQCRASLREACVDGVCGPCTAAHQCPKAFGCRTTTGECDTCRLAGECRDGESCNGGMCGGCETAVSCDGLLCRDGVCAPCAEGEGDTLCAEQYADAEYVCTADGVCSPPRCTAGLDCWLTRRVCAPSGRCMPCEGTYDCLDEASGGYPAGTSCIAGLCVEGDCEVSADCPADRPICGETLRCRACQDHAECLEREEVETGYICQPVTGRCLEGDCYPEGAACGAGGQQVCGDDHWCRPCASDGECRATLTSDSGVCDGGLCRIGCGSALGCAEGQVCGLDHRCRTCASDAECAAQYSSNYLCVGDECREAECRDDMDCGAGQRICEDLVCRDCANHAACGAGRVCAGGNCVTGDCFPAAGACGEADDRICSGDLVCRDCVFDGECRAALDSSEALCDGGRCVVGCDDAGDCPDWQVCGADHRCRGCGADAECVAAYGSGYLCLDELCAEAQCLSDEDCAGGQQICDGGACRGCVTHDECGEGRVCGGGACVAGDCHPAGSACGEPADRICGEDLTCRDCEDDGECRASLSSDDAVCEDGRCVAGCETSGDCPNGGVCQGSRCRPCANGPDATTDDCQANGYPAGVLCVAGACVTAACNEVVSCADRRPCVAGDCVDCTAEDDAYCTTRGLLCDTAHSTCVGCTIDLDCADGRRVCDRGVCRDCLPGDCGAGSVCVEGACLEGDCWIDGTLWATGATAAGNVCLRCDPGVTRFAWSANPGASCDDGDACTFADQCHAQVAGVCRGVAYECPGTACARGVCHGEGPNDCTLEPRETWDGCVVDGVCYLHGQASDANPCLVCDGASGALEPRDEGARCGACRTCQDAAGSLRCRPVADGEDPHNDCALRCQACDGFGGCLWTPAGTDPNDDCAAEPETTCGTTGLCAGGGDRCAYWTDVAGVTDHNECTSGDRCDGAGSVTANRLPDGTSCQADTKICRVGVCGDCLPGDCPEGRICGDGSCVAGDCWPAGGSCGASRDRVCGDDFVCADCPNDAACVAATGADHAICEDGRCVVGCAANGDCPASGICAAGRCRACANEAGGAIDDCQANGFGAGVLCVAGACVAAECNDTQVCAGGRVCVEGACVDCVLGDDDHCTTRGLVCDTATRTCVQCLTDGECTGGARICDAHVCRDCLSGECGANRVCDAGQCVTGECVANGDCDQRICADHACRLCENEAGATVDDCRAAGYASAICVAGLCQDKDCNEVVPCPPERSICTAANVCVGCESDADCGGATPICDAATHSCRGCSQGADECPFGAVCVDGACNDGDCYIGGAYYEDGDVRDVCSACDPVRNRYGWSPTGAGCDDGDPCTQADSCSPLQAGMEYCAGEAYTCPLSPPPCAEAVCDGTGGCDFVRRAEFSGCYFPDLGVLGEDGCFEPDEGYPGNPCRRCNANENAWLDRPAGTKCGTCETCQQSPNGYAVCTAVDDYEDPHDDCWLDCQVCVGGVCAWSNGPDPSNDCADELTTDPCGQTGHCDPARVGTCALRAAGSYTGVSDDNVCTTNDRCDGSGHIVADAVQNGPPYTWCRGGAKVCRDGACDDCTASDQCAPGMVCHNGSCTAGTCTDDASCLDGSNPPLDPCYQYICQEQLGERRCVAVYDNAATCAPTDPCRTVNPRCVNGECVADPKDCSHLDDRPCLVGTCQADTGQCVATPQEGEPCSDGSLCTGYGGTSADRCGADGVCRGELLCGPDPAPCALACNPASGLCHSPPFIVGGQCYVDGQCVGDQYVDPVSQCRRCDVQETQRAWTIDETISCTDDLWCTTDGCQLDVCVSTLDPGTCLIDGVCYTDGDTHPEDSCLRCEPGVATDEWTLVSGTCFIDGVCHDAGEQDPARPCLSCQTSSSTVRWTLASGACLIDDTCYAEDESDPERDCMSCQPSYDTGAWRLRSNTCYIDAVCYVAGDDQGTATGQPELACLTCAPYRSTSEWTRRNDSCIIDGRCYDAGALEPDNACRECNPYTNPSQWWSDDTNACTDDITCTDDVCLGGECVNTANDASCEDTCARCDPATGDLVTGCVYDSVTNGIACDDGLPETGESIGDFCWSGRCAGVAVTATTGGYAGTAWAVRFSSDTRYLLKGIDGLGSQSQYDSYEVAPTTYRSRTGYDFGGRHYRVGFFALPGGSTYLTVYHRSDNQAYYLVRHDVEDEPMDTVTPPPTATGYSQPVTALAPDGSFVVLSTRAYNDTSPDAQVLLLHETTGLTEAGRYTLGTCPASGPCWPQVRALAFSPDGTTLFYADSKPDGNLDLAATRTLAHVGDAAQDLWRITTDAGNGTMREIAVSPDGSLLALSYDNRFELMDVATRQVTASMSDELEGVRFAPHGGWLGGRRVYPVFNAPAGADVSLYATADFSLLLRIPFNTDEFVPQEDWDLSPNGRFVAVERGRPPHPAGIMLYELHALDAPYPACTTDGDCAADQFCNLSLRCVASPCHNGADDDGDGLADAADPDCATGHIEFAP